MRTRCFRLTVAFAAGVISACNDAAVNEVTAPRIAATPAAPVAEQFPTIEEFTSAGIPSAIGIQISLDPRFEDQNRQFVVDAHVTFQWANDVSVSLQASLLNKNGQTVNSGNSGMTWKRLALPVASGDTTFSVSISTNNTTCGLLGKSSASGGAAQVALESRLLQIGLYSQTVSKTGPDVTQPACAPPPPPPPECTYAPATRLTSTPANALAAETVSCPESYPVPPSGGSADYTVCVTVWRQLWVWDDYAQVYTLATEWLVGVYCYTTQAT